MLPYILILFSVSLIILIGLKSKKYKFIFIPVMILTLFAGFRNYTIGTDTIVYVNDFRNVLNYNYYYFDPNIEFGYQYLVYTILKFTNDYHWYLLAVALITTILMVSAIKKYSSDYLLSIYIYITFGFYTFLFNTVRQAIALSILFYGSKFLVDKNFFKYFIIIFISSLFHISAWIMLPFYFLVHLKMKLEYKLMLTFFSSLVISGGVIQYLALSNQRYEQYTVQAENAGGYLLISFYMAIALFLYLLGRKARETNEQYRVLEQLYFCGLLFVIPIVFLGSDPSGPQRVLYNFSVYLILLLPILLNNRFDNVLYKSIFVILAFIYFVMITYQLYGIYPYVINDYFRIF